MPRDTFTLWYIIVGLLLLGMALSNTTLKRLPLTTSLAYLLVGVALGPMALGMIRLDAIEWAGLIERLTEVAVIVSLFVAGLKLRTQARWWIPIRLAFLSMALTVGLIALAGVFLLGLPLGAAVLLGAILAPTDPVLASDVQVRDPDDRDKLRFSLTGEAGLNDGTAFPFVMLGLGLLGLHDLGRWGWRWIAVDLVWAIAGGLAIGAVMGFGVGKFVVYLRRKHQEAAGLDDFLGMGLLALVYGAALLAHTYGFLAAFAAGVAMNRTSLPGSERGMEKEKAPEQMGRAVLEFNEQLERALEFTAVILLGGMLTAAYMPRQALWFVPLLFLAIRPIAVLLGLWGGGFRLLGVQRGMICWFGVRGIGSIYYLMYAMNHGVPEEMGRFLVGLTFTVVAASIAVHGISVTPLMGRYREKVGGLEAGKEQDGD